MVMPVMNIRVMRVGVLDRLVRMDVGMRLLPVFVGVVLGLGLGLGLMLMLMLMLVLVLVLVVVVVVYVVDM
jgi:hypothetical protein